jgi:4-hydroxy-4-methyl-2-oxoglutarate aldolase
MPNMTVTIHSAPHSDLTSAEVEAWRSVPVAIAVDLARDIGQIDPAIRPLNPPGRQPHLFGRARTVLCEPPDFGAVVHALDIVSPGDVLMIAAGGNSEFAMIGEILGGHVRTRGAVGVVCDGAVRDVATLASWPDFAVFTRFVTPRGPISADHGSIDLPVVIGGRVVTPGDLVIGDDDGVVALSPSTVRSRLMDAKDRQAREAGWIDSLKSGRSALETFGLGARKSL